MFAEERKQLIIDLLNSKRKLSVQELCVKFAASPGTIRNDLQELESRSLLKRTHGGAISLNRIGFEHNADEKDILHFAEKQSIARAALHLIDDGDTIALDTGTTTMELAKLLGFKKDLMVVTNDLKIALELESAENITVIMVGGTVRRNFHCTIGPQAVQSLADIRVDKTFAAANGISLNAGVTTPNIDTADIKRDFIRMSNETILLCDSSKIGRISFKRFAELSEIKTLVTDNHITPQQKQDLKEQGIEVVTENEK